MSSTGALSVTPPKPPARDDRFQVRDRPPDARSPGQRDRDRILFTSAFRRLAGVTQVVASDEGDIFHNRLTHSLEVAQVGRRLADKFVSQQRPLAEKFQIDPDVVEAACLAHDLGHPPFGHIAEVLLDQLAVSKDLPDGFEGNAQSFRIVTKLAFRSPEVVGLNLTRAVLNALLKYPYLRGPDGKRHRKWGAYSSEKPELTFARELSRPGDDNKCPEAEIMDWADDITYSVHDLEDFYRAGLIPIGLLARDKRERARFFAGAEKHLQDTEEMIHPSEMSALIEAFDGLFDIVVIETAYTGTQVQRADLRTLTAGLIRRYITDTKLQESGDTALQIPAGYRREVTMLKELTWHYVIHNAALATQQYGQRKLINDLFTIFHEVAKSPEDYHVFPPSTREQLEELDNKLKEKKIKQEEWKKARTRLIVDLIAGMTEQHAINMHRRLTSTSLGSALDYLGR